MTYSYNRTAGRLPMEQEIIRQLKKLGGEAPAWRLVIRRSGYDRALRSLVKGGYITEFQQADEDGDEADWLRLESEPDWIATAAGQISKTRLEAWCKRKGWPMPTYEAYGRKVEAYWSRNPPGMDRKQMETELEMVGAKVRPEWNRGQPGTSVSNISYFKAWHWDE